MLLRLGPLLLLLPQLAITLVFFYWPASQAVWQSFLLQDAFGLKTSFVWFENYQDLFRNREYFNAFLTTAVFSIAVDQDLRTTRPLASWLASNLRLPNRDEGRENRLAYVFRDPTRFDSAGIAEVTYNV